MQMEREATLRRDRSAWLRSCTKSSLLIALASILTATTFGCSDGSDGSGLSSRRARRNSPPAAGTADDHDESDTEGSNDTDVGNPNADSRPDAPTTPGTSATQFAVTLAQNTPTVDLGESVDLDVSVEPKNGFSGMVDITVAGLPAGVTASTVQAAIAPSATAPTTVKLKLTATVDAVVTAPGASSALVITGKAGSVTATANANFKVAPKLKLTIPVNVDALRAANTTYRDEWGSAFGASQRPLKTQQGNGIVVTVFNADSKQHIIHGASGFTHGSTAAGTEIQPNAFEMLNGAVRTRTLNVGANVNGYPHEGAQGVGASFRIRVEAAP
ncbi:MAG: hypothetical protein KF764_34435 [Labilithrix sp.]|nr:hypothetical protein [Labilithrix sp.]MBX3224337.1 hypothetical protein [Labilithrix sp.]